MKADCILVRFGEIALKGRNRIFFEKKLIANIKTALKSRGIKFGDVKRIPGRILVESGDGRALDALGRVFGVTSFSPASEVKSGIEGVNEAALRVLREDNPENFRVSARRLDKTLPKTSSEINEEVGRFLVEKTGCAVKLKNPALDVGVELTKNSAYVHTKTFEGLGGLPVGVSGKVLCLLSGGIDSPVAAWLAMKRGCETVLLHFLHEDKRRPSKIIDLAGVLREYQPDLKLLLAPTSEIEKDIIKNIPAKYRIIVLRRVFMRISKAVADKMGLKAVVTGDNIGQVASQTLENMRVIREAFDGLMILPLACYDKQETIDLAKKIGTYDVSLLPYEDCCSFMVPRHPETKAGVGEIIELEGRLDQNLLGEAVGGLTEINLISRK